MRALDFGGVLNDPVPGPAAPREDATDEALVRDLLVCGDERLSAPADLEHPPSTLGRGVNPREGTRAWRWKLNQGADCAVIRVLPPTAARFRATSHCVRRTASDRVRVFSSRRRSGVVRWKGMLPTIMGP